MYLQKDIENYKFGIKPIKTNRCDEIGWLKNNFVELTEKLDEEKKNQNRMMLFHTIFNQYSVSGAKYNVAFYKKIYFTAIIFN